MEKEVIRIEKGTMAVESFVDTGAKLPLFRLSLVDGSESLTLTESEIIDLFKIPQEDILKIVSETEKEVEVLTNREKLLEEINEVVKELLFSQDIYNFIVNGQGEDYDENVENAWNLLRSHIKVNTLVGDSMSLDLSKDYGSIIADIGGTSAYCAVEFFNYNNASFLSVSPRIVVNDTDEISIKELSCYEMLKKLYGSYIINE